MTYELKEHTADIAFEAIGKDLNDLFLSCAEALTDISVDREGLSEEKKVTIHLSAENTENLLFNFLDELIFYKDAEQLLFKTFEISIKENLLKAVLKGEKINSEKHELRNDVKAVTMHNYVVEQTEKGWRAYVILDI